MNADPDLRLDGLSIWVDGREFPGASDDFDSNWLRLRVLMEAPGATVACQGAVLMTTDFRRFRDELAAMNATLAGEATLEGYEPALKARLTMKGLGQVDGEVEITPDQLSQYHRFRLDLDQSYLPALIAGCDAILARFPVVGAG